MCLRIEIIDFNKTNKIKNKKMKSFFFVQQLRSTDLQEHLRADSVWRNVSKPRGSPDREAGLHRKPQRLFVRRQHDLPETEHPPVERRLERRFRGQLHGGRQKISRKEPDDRDGVQDLRRRRDAGCKS